MAITFRPTSGTGFSTATSIAALGASLAITFPPALAANDLLLLGILLSGGSAAAFSGFSAVPGPTFPLNVSSLRFWLLYKVATGSESGSQNITWTTNASAACWLQAVSGVDTTTPFDGLNAASSTNTSTNTRTTTDLTATSTSDVPWSAIGQLVNGAVMGTEPSGWTNRIDLTNGGSGSNAQALCLSYGAVLSTTDDPAVTFTLGGSHATTAAWGVLKAAASAATLPPSGRSISQAVQRAAYYHHKEPPDDGHRGHLHRGWRLDGRTGLTLPQSYARGGTGRRADRRADAPRLYGRA